MSIDPTQRRAILFAASRGALPPAWLEITGLAVPPEGLLLDLGLYRTPVLPCLALGRLRVAPGRAARRCSRQVPILSNHVAPLAAARDARLLAFGQDPDGRRICMSGLPCLGLGLSFETPLPPPP